MNSKNLLIYTFIIFAFVVCGSGQTFAQAPKPIVSNLRGSGYLGCGCAFQTLTEAKKPRSQRIVFWSEDEREAILNVNGRDTTFKLTKQGKRPRNQKIGTRYFDEYAANGMTVKIDYLITRICLKGEEDCEATSFDATITVAKGKLKTVTKTKGACGC